MANSGTYIKSADITNELAAAFMDQTDPALDLSMYFDYADKCIINLALANNILVSGIAVDNNGDLYDINLKMYGLNCLYSLLFTDKSYVQNSTDPANLSDSVAYDKYVRARIDCDKAASVFASKVTPSTITNTANSSKATIAMFSMARG